MKMKRNSPFLRLLCHLTLAAMLITGFGTASLAADAAPQAGEELEVLAPNDENLEHFSVTAVQLDDANAEEPSLSCKSAMVVDMDTGRVIYDYNGDIQSYPASTTKVMTAYLCLKYGDLDAMVTVEPGILADVSYDATALGLVTGEEIQVRSLLQSMMVISACDSSNVIAQHVSGSVEAFAELMNREAAALGCTGTHFVNAHGLHNPEHYTTAHDMILIARAAMAYPEFREIVSSPSVTMAATSRNRARVLKNSNLLLPDSGTSYAYPYATGVKTGYTWQAGYPLVSAAEKDGVRLLAVVYGPSTPANRYTSSRNLLQWAFDHYESEGETETPEDFVQPFRDVRKDAWYGDSVAWAAEQGITNGTSETAFSPDEVCTRGQIVTLLWRALGSPKSDGTVAFADVDKEDYFYDAVQWAVSEGITQGTGEGTFSPDQPCTRAQTVTFLYRYSGEGLEAQDVDADEDGVFEDVAKDAYYADAVYWARRNGVTEGTSDTTFSPDETCTRAQIVTFLYRYLVPAEESESRVKAA